MAIIERHACPPSTAALPPHPTPPPTPTQVVFLPNYNVTEAELIIPAAELRCVGAWAWRCERAPPPVVLPAWPARPLCLAPAVCPACSQHISTAGTEASGTSNMKFALSEPGSGAAATAVAAPLTHAP